MLRFQAIDESEALARVVGLGGFVFLFVVHVAGHRIFSASAAASAKRIDGPFNLLRRWLFHHELSMEGYRSADISPYFRVNGRPPKTMAYEEANE